MLKYSLSISGICAIGLVSVLTTPASAEWVIAWRKSGKVCYVGEIPLSEPTRKIYEKDISKGHASKKLACEMAKKLSTSDADTSEEKCFTYSTDSIVECKNVDVKL